MNYEVTAKRNNENIRCQGAGASFQPQPLPSSRILTGSYSILLGQHLLACRMATEPVRLVMKE